MRSINNFPQPSSLSRSCFCLHLVYWHFAHPHSLHPHSFLTMHSFGFGIPSVLLWLFVLLFLSVARLASCAPIAVAGGIGLAGHADVNQRHPHVLSNNAPKTPSLVPIPAQITPKPAGVHTTSSKQHPSPPPLTTDIIDIDTSGPTRPFPFKLLEYLTKSTHTHQDSNAHSANTFFPTFFRKDDPDNLAFVLRGRFPFNYLSRIPPPRGSASIMILSSASTGTTSSTPTLDVTTLPATEGRPAVEHEPSESSQLPLGILQTNVDSDALPDSPSAKFFGMTIPAILEKLKCLVRHESEKTQGTCFFVFFRMILLT